MKPHVTPPKVQYILQYTDSNSVLQNVDVTPDFDSWKEFDTDIVRDNLSAAFIQIQTGGISFTGDSYDIIREIYETQGIQAIAKLIINLRKDNFPNLWTYEQKISLDLNFVKYERTQTTIILEANENGLKEMVKSNNSQKYDIPVDDLLPEKLIYDGLEIKETFTWFPAPISDIKPVIERMSGDTGYRQTVSFYPGVVIEAQDINQNFINAHLQSPQVLYRGPNPDNTTGLQSWDGVAWVGTNSAPRILKSSSAQTLNVSIKATLKVNFGLPIENLSIFIVQYADYPADAIYNLPSRWTIICDVPTSGDTEITAILNGSVITTTDPILCNMAIGIQFDRIVGTTNESLVLNKFEFETGGYIQVEWTALPKNNVNVPVVSEQKLLQSLVDNLTETTDTYTASIDEHDETIRIAAGESIRNFQTQYLHTSFQDFSNYMKSCWGYDYEITGNAIRFAHRDNFFQNVPALTIPEINNIKLSVNETYIYTGVKIGIALVQYLSINGTDEFRFLEEWSTGVKNVVNILDLTCPYRTDSYGFQLLSEKQYTSNSTDDQSDNSIFVLHVKKSGDNYILNRDAVVTGVSSPSTIFNAIFSPRKCLMRNSSLLGISSSALKFTSAGGNADITIDGVSEKADIPILFSLFSADALDADVGDIIDLPDFKNGLVSCTYRGETFQGFIKKLSHFWGENKKTSLTLFLQKGTFSYSSKWGNFICETTEVIMPDILDNHITVTIDGRIVTVSSALPVATTIEVTVFCNVSHSNVDGNFIFIIPVGETTSEQTYDYDVIETIVMGIVPALDSTYEYTW